MAERTPPPLSPAASELLRAFRDDESPTKAARHQGLSALRSRLERESSAAVGGHSYAKVIAITVGLAAAVLLAVKLVGVGVTALAAGARQPAMEAPYLDNGATEGGRAISREPAARRPRGRTRRSSEPVAAPAAVTAEPTPPPPAPTVEAPSSLSSSPSPSPAPRSVPTRAPSSSSSAADLVAELALIKRAQGARQQRRPAAGLAALAEHARRFPRGTLADERMVLEAELLCDRGEVASARARVRRFLKTRARSALAGRMRHVCVD